MKELILVTGSSGFIGINLVKSLNKKKVPFMTLGRSKENDIQVDLRFNKPLKIPKLCTRIIHLAADIEYFGSWKKLARTNIFGTKLILKNLPKTIKKFVYISSIEASEPKSNYGLSKLKGEELVKKTCTKLGVNFCILRLGNVYGPQNPFILIQLKNMITDDNDYLRRYFNCLKNISVFPVFVDDVAHAIESVVFSDLNGLYTLAGEKPYTLQSIRQLLIKNLNLKNKNNYHSASPFLFFLRNTWHKLKHRADFVDYLLNKAGERKIMVSPKLPFHYETSFEQGIKKMYKQNL
jgi:nucleoside-diphosphate-sugar epimerase